MKRTKYILKPIGLVGILFTLYSSALGSNRSDTIAIHSVGHGSLYFEYNNLVIHVDPYSAQADYNSLPDASLVFITHGHSDHYDLNALNKIKTDSTTMICTQAVKNMGTFTGTTSVLNNGDSAVFKGIPVKAVPAYNVTSTWHTKGVGNGYVFTFGEKRVYVAGDTESIPEMGNLGKIDIAFLPMNLPYTMTPSAAATAAKLIQPDILYIYHFGNSDTASLRKLLIDQSMKIRMGKSVYYEPDKREGSTRAAEVNIENEMWFYPNPVRDYLTVSNLNPGSSISLFNLSGQLLLKQDQKNGGDSQMDMKSLIPGIYIMRYQDNQLEKSSLLFKE
jgi:L-ascorbate metabolism protein UlaG (beta-lactamase superfamily)